MAGGVLTIQESCKHGRHGSLYAAVHLNLTALLTGEGGSLIMLCQYDMHDAAIRLYLTALLCRLP